jgi:predicted DNA-binding WGR domain protein
MAFFTHTDPAKNRHRFYVVQLSPTLFGDWTLLREWSRSRSPGTVCMTSFDGYHEAQQAKARAIKRRLQHGYNEHAA